MATKQSYLTGAGDFSLDEVKLVTSTGMVIDLSESVMGITLYEDIFSLTITGTIAITDSVNLTSHGPIIGQEYLHLKIKTPSLSSEDSIINFSENAFLVHTISKRQPIRNNIQGVVLSFVSQELVKNQRLKVTRSLTASWSDIVKKMLVDYLDIKKNITIEPSAGIKKFVAPNIRPLDVVVMGMKQAVAKFKGEPTYLFYETLKGFNFRTLASLYNESSRIQYLTVPPGTNPPMAGRDYDLAKELRTVLDYEIISNNDSAINYRTGMYGSKLITHDIISKSYETKIYNLHDNFENESHIVGGVTGGREEFPLVSALHVNDKGLRVSDFPARTFLMPTSLSGGVDSQHTTENNTNPYMAYDPHKWLQRRNSQMIQLENALNVNILVHGNTIISAGDIVTLNLPRKAVVKSRDTLDKFYQGSFLIKKIRHDFMFTSAPQKHRMYMNLVKDSLQEELLAPADNIEPSSEEESLITNYEYSSSNLLT